jgi:hypothetical protein
MSMFATFVVTRISPYRARKSVIGAIAVPLLFPTASLAVTMVLAPDHFSDNNTVALCQCSSRSCSNFVQGVGVNNALPVLQVSMGGSY